MVERAPVERLVPDLVRLARQLGNVAHDAEEVRIRRSPLGGLPHELAQLRILDLVVAQHPDVGHRRDPPGPHRSTGRLHACTCYVQESSGISAASQGRRGADPMNVDLTEQTFDEALAAADGLVMVDFWAPWCGPCRAIAPVLEALAETSQGRVSLMKVNVDEQPALAARYEIRAIPTVLFLRDGAVVDRVVGAVPKAALEAIIAAV